MNGSEVRRAPWLWRAAAAVVRRLPVGRFRVAHALGRRWRATFAARLPPRLGGAWFVCDLRDALSVDAWFAGVYEPQETALVLELLKPGMTFVDVGANWGYFSLIAAARVGPQGRVISWEPDSRVRQRLETAVELNGFDHVIIAPWAASDADGVVPFAGFAESGGNFGVSRIVEGEGAASQAVAARTLDSALEESGVAHVDLLKMDIEGAEGRALAGMSRLLDQGRVDRILLELHPAALEAGGDSSVSIAERLHAAGYEGWTIDHAPATTRRAAYTRRPDSREWLNRTKPADPLGAWPHQLWVRRGAPG